MKIEDAFIWATIIVVLGVVNLGGQYLLARWLVGRGALKALLSRLLAFIFFFAVGGAILAFWFVRKG
ncbi:MAG: hypothetical protein EBR82_02090 [Caulobacteraceae bacterium]|nr:hypothetical protein [Caulobacteraceae bacterium]